eukprot:CAMPEP_0116152768 /NCGR_PEP_ID=MMETSP0329-20121206/20857_1 /TAXON_ID=697910 /ORGANISM="Pseudo-nitzschia arenysensis, Strain B593" /LENGTH=110 /DNA_ID=CAMNT_0003649571 /DNA_START=179 /DNA_END=511 /DNA_ORIENTATION=+
MTTTDLTSGTPKSLAAIEDSDIIESNNDSPLTTTPQGIGGNENTEKFYILSKASLHPDDLVAFAKSQAILNAAYKKRQEKYYQTPVAARMVTGKNLQKLHPLAVRKAEFC